MASTECLCCHDLEFRKPIYISAASKEKDKWPFINLTLSDFQAKCTYCSLLQRMVLHFAPRIEQYEEPTLHLKLEERIQQYKEPTLHLKLEESCAVLAELKGTDPKGGHSKASIVRFYFYIQEKVGRLRLSLPFRPRSFICSRW